MDYLEMFYALAPPILYAAGRLLDARNKGELVSWPIFVKTIVASFVTAGLVTQADADIWSAVATSSIVTLAIDALINGLVDKFGRTQPPPAGSG